jgi:hypothetical protein
MPGSKYQDKVPPSALSGNSVQTFSFLASSFGGRPNSGLAFNASSTTSIPRQPTINCRTIEPNNSGDDFGTFAALNTDHRTLTHGLERGLIQSSRIVLSHARRESDSRHRIKKNFYLFIYRLIHHHYPYSKWIRAARTRDRHRVHNCSTLRPVGI